MVNAILANVRSTISPMKTESNWEGTLRRAQLILGRHSLWRVGLGRPSKYGIAFAFLLALPQFALAADKKEANVTEAVRDVRLLAAQAAPRPAVVNETVREGTAVHTGSDSRAELTYTDLSVTRLGANTVFNFDAATRSYDLKSGATLISAPKQAGTVGSPQEMTTQAGDGVPAAVAAGR